MKRKIKNTDVIPGSHIMKGLLLMVCAAILAGCTTDDTLSANDANGDIPVTFITGIQSVALPAAQPATPDTRTATDDEGQVVWTDGDAISLFMLSHDGELYNGVLPGGLNKKYNVSSSSGTLLPADGKPLYYPRQKAVDFIAVWPYSDKWGQEAVTGGKPFIMHLSLDNQYTAVSQARCDILHSNNARNITSSKDAVALNFRHVLSKLRFNITLGDGLTGGNVTGIRLDGMPSDIDIDIRDGSLNEMHVGSKISILKLDAPTADATFAAIVAPQPADLYINRRIYIIVDGIKYIGTLPDADAYEAGKMYTYPVTVQKSGVDVGTPSITKWNTNDHGTGTAESVYTLTFNANGGNGTPPAPQEAGSITGIVLPDGTGLTPPATGKVFIGWGTATALSGNFHRAGTTFVPAGNVTLYALWATPGEIEEFPIPIYNAAELAQIANGLDKHYKLMNDITVSNWAPIGSESNPFKGTFNGQGHVITVESFRVSTDDEFVGLFGVGNGFHIRQVCVAGTSTGINFENSATSSFGGIMGKAVNECVFENCLVTANITVTGVRYLGGIIGEHYYNGDKRGFMKNCLMLGTLWNKTQSQQKRTWVMGLGGFGRLTRVNCVVLSASLRSENTQITKVIRLGHVNENYNSYANKSMTFTPIPDSADEIEMGTDCEAKPGEAWWKNPGTWKNDGGYSAWDFTNIWKMGDDGYPCLRIVNQ